jgi:ketosteroid isomerase-like protein
MKRFVVLCPLGMMVALSVLSPVSAGGWSPEQQEVIDRIEWCYDRWLDAYSKRNVDVYFDACAEKDSLVWSTANGAPSTQDRSRRATSEEWSQMKNLYWEDFTPTEVRIHGDTAAIYAYDVWVNTSSDGSETKSERKVLWIFHKEGGVWRLVDGMVAPVN